MDISIPRPRIIGLCAMGALFLLGLPANGAQAAEFQIGGKFTSLLATLLGDDENRVTLLVPGRNLKIECFSGHALSGSEIIDKTKALAKLFFNGCVALVHKTGSLLPCTVDSVNATAIFLPVSSGGTMYVKAEPDGSETYTTVRLLGESCPLPEENPVAGSVTGEVTTNGSVVDLLSYSKFTSEFMFDTLKFGGFSAYIGAIATALLTGAHSGITFGVA